MWHRLFIPYAQYLITIHQKWPMAGDFDMDVSLSQTCLL